MADFKWNEGGIEALQQQALSTLIETVQPIIDELTDELHGQAADVVRPRVQSALADVGSSDEFIDQLTEHIVNNTRLILKPAA